MCNECFIIFIVRILFAGRAIEMGVLKFFTVDLLVYRTE